MRRRRLSQRSLHGQLLFAELGSDSITLDCLLVGAAKSVTSAVPVTLTARLPAPAAAAEPAIVLLQQWADDIMAIELRVSDGRTGPQVELAAVSGRVVLESYETE